MIDLWFILSPLCKKIYDSLNNRQLDFVRYSFFILFPLDTKKGFKQWKSINFPKTISPFSYISLTCVTCYFVIKLLKILYWRNVNLNIEANKLLNKLRWSKRLRLSKYIYILFISAFASFEHNKQFKCQSHLQFSQFQRKYKLWIHGRI